MDIEHHPVRIPTHVERVATPGTSLLSLLLTLGASSKVIAVTPEIIGNPWATRVEPRLAHLPVFFTGDDLVSIESLVDARPDLVIAWSRETPAGALLEAARLPIAAVHFGTTHEILEAVSTLGDILGASQAEAARKYVARFRSILGNLEERTSHLLPTERPRVYYAAGDPLTTEGSASFVTSWLDVTGGENVAASSGIRALRATVSLETILAWNPDVIVVRDARTGRAIRADARWVGVRAVIDGRVLVSPRGVTSWCTRGGESLLQLLWAARALHPDWFADGRLDMRLETRRFYEDFFGYRLSEAEITEILDPP